MVDTGGEVISISTATAEDLEQAARRKIALRVYGTSGWDRDAFLMPGVNLSFQDIAYHNFSVVVLNLQAPSVLLGFQVGGIVGHKFLSPYRVSLDLDAERAAAGAKARADAVPSVRVSVCHRWPVPSLQPWPLRASRSARRVCACRQRASSSGVSISSGRTGCARPSRSIDTNVR